MLFAAATGIFFIILSKAATPSAPAVGFYFNPIASSFTNGQQISVQVMGNTTVPAQAMTALVKYDPTVLRLDDTQATTGIDGTWQTKAGCGPSDQVPVAPYGPSDFAPCRPAGEAYFVVANNLPSNLHPAGNNLVVGNLKFTVLKVPAGGTTTLTIDSNRSNTKMTNSVTPGAQATLDAGAVVNSAYTINAAASAGTGTGNTGGNPGAAPVTKPGTTTTTTKKTTGTTNNTSPGNPPTDTSTTTTEQPVTPTAPIKQINSGNASGTSDTDDSEVAGAKTLSTPMLLVVSGTLAAVIVGTTMLAFSGPVRAAVKSTVTGASHMLHHSHPVAAGHVPTGPVHVVDNVSHIEPPHQNNTVPSAGESVGNIVKPNEPPTTPAGQ